MKGWEYKKLRLNDKRENRCAEKKFNQLGKEGWELACVYTTDNDYVFAMFRREKEGDR